MVKVRNRAMRCFGPHGNEAARKSEDARRARVRAQGSHGLDRAAWDVHRARLFGRCEAKAGIEPFGSLVEQVINEEPYASADRVFWIVDNGSSHRGERSVKRLEGKWPNLWRSLVNVLISWT
jgi:hypothetical protein